MRPRILWLSQLASAQERVGRACPHEADFVPASLPEAEVTVVDVTAAPIPDARPYAGVVVGGSVGCVHDADDWRRALLAWLRHYDGPFLGICGGHQMVAVARGGEVTRGGFEQIGPRPLRVPGLDVAWVAQAHRDAVTRVPAGAEVWAADEVCVQALRYGPAQWTTQFHPEVNPEIAPALWAGAATPPRPGELEATIAGGRALLAAWMAAVRG